MWRNFMKKFLAIILALLYLTVSSGATIHLHYCMGKLVNWGLWHNKISDKCGNCGMAKQKQKTSKGCCKDEQTLVKVDKDQKASLLQYNFSKQSNDFTPYYSIIKNNSACILSLVREYPTTHAPPYKEKVQEFIRNCVFRI